MHRKNEQREKTIESAPERQAHHVRLALPTDNVWSELVPSTLLRVSDALSDLLLECSGILAPLFASLNVCRRLVVG